MQERRRDCASALIVANVAGQDGQAVAQRRRGDDQIGLRERMPRLAAFLDQQPARIAYRPRSHCGRRPR
jgi:hypothetical protein